jgi:two-component system OmpR family sensor kinase
VARHFLVLYLLIVLTLAAVSWGQDKLLQAYGARDGSDERVLAAALSAVESQLQSSPASDWKAVVERVSAKTGGSYELFAAADIAGGKTLTELKRGKIAYMQAARGETWALKQLNDGHVLAFKSQASETPRGPLEWLITTLFYAAMALVLMIWIWPLTRDLRTLEYAAARYGNRNWAFDAPIKPRSQIYALAETFRRMALRIDGLIASHKDMSNAVSHEIKTPLSRMQFEIELAQKAKSFSEVETSLNNIKADIAAINDLVSATLKYAILERADLSLNIGTHNLTKLLPAITAYVRQDIRPDIEIRTELRGDTDHVTCDLHLIETVVKNLLYNAARYAKHEVHLAFAVHDGVNQLLVDDDGPGIPEKDRQRVFGSFVQLESNQPNKGLGLGLAIVKRAIEWHDGEVAIANSPSGGARISAVWPIRSAKDKHITFSKGHKLA